MARQYRCDVCSRNTDEIVAKLFVTPMIRGRGGNAFNSNYTHHCDVGVCCHERLMKGFQWQERKTAAEYQKSRRKTTPRKSRA